MSKTDALSALNLTKDERARVLDLGDELQVTLIEPITYKHSKLDGERTLTELRLAKRVKGKHLKIMDQAKGDMAQSLALVAALSGVPIHAMDELDAHDMETALALVEPFLPQPRRAKTG